MSATHHPHAYLRTSPPHVRKAAARASRPAPLSRSQGFSKASLKGNKAKSLGQEEETIVEEEEDMGSSFLQYWCVFECLFQSSSLAPPAPPPSSASTDSNGQRHVRETDRRSQQFNPLLLRKVCTRENSFPSVSLNLLTAPQLPPQGWLPGPRFKFLPPTLHSVP